MKSGAIKAPEEFRGGRNSCRMRNSQNPSRRRLTHGILKGREDGDRTFQMVVSAKPMSQRQEKWGSSAQNSL